MIGQMEGLHLSIINKLPIKVKEVKNNYNNILLIDNYNKEYHLYKLDVKHYLIYYELIKSKFFLKAIFELHENNDYFLLFEESINSTEKNVIIKKLFKTYFNVFDDFKFEIVLKKKFFKNLQNIYKVLDDKFSYLELRIREIELSPIKDDVSWVILTKYNIFLDAKIFLYDLQQDIFKYIDDSESISYGLVYNSDFFNSYKNGLIEPKFNLYYAPISALLFRLYLECDELQFHNYIIEILKGFDEFNQKYFCFMCLYVYILNARIEYIPNNYNICSYIAISKKIKIFINKFGDYLK